MKSLYQYICEGIRKWALLAEWWPKIKDIISPYTFNELNTGYKPEEYCFLLKSKRPTELWITDSNRDKAIQILSDIGDFNIIKDQGNNFEASLTIPGLNHPIHVFNTGKGMKESGIDTAEQENMMCDVFNNYFRKGYTQDQAISNIAGTDKSRKSWVISSWEHCKDIDTITQGGYQNYYMVRVDNRNDSVVTSYLNFRKKYQITRGFGQITSVDPTDVIMDNEKSVGKITSAFQDFCNKIDNGEADEALKDYRRFVKDNTFILPISLKKAVRKNDISTGSSSHFTFYNTEEGKVSKPKVLSVEYIGVTPMNIKEKPDNIEVGDAEVIFGRKNIPIENITGVYAYVKCKKGTLGTDDEIAKITYRTFGKALAIDITLNPEKNSTAFGKVSTHTWREIFNHKSKGQMSMLTDDQKKVFIEFFKNFNENEKDIDDIVADGMKIGNQRFPYALFK